MTIFARTVRCEMCGYHWQERLLRPAAEAFESADAELRRRAAWFEQGLAALEAASTVVSKQSALYKKIDAAIRAAKQQGDSKDDDTRSRQVL